MTLSKNFFLLVVAFFAMAALVSATTFVLSTDEPARISRLGIPPALPGWQ